MNALLARLQARSAPAPRANPPPPAHPAEPPPRAASRDGRPLFGLGCTVTTPAVMELIQSGALNPGYILARHLRGDWGDLDAEDAVANDLAIKRGGRISSAYNLPCGVVWCITEAEDDHGIRHFTTILLPHEY